MRSFPDEENPLGKPLFTKREVKTVAFEITQEEMDVYNDHNLPPQSQSHSAPFR